MTTITITEDAKPAAAGLPVGTPVKIEVETGAHLVIVRKGSHDPEKRKAVLRRLIDDMNNRVYDPTIETAAEAIKAMREERGG